MDTPPRNALTGICGAAGARRCRGARARSAAKRARPAHYCSAVQSPTSTSVTLFRRGGPPRVRDGAWQLLAPRSLSAPAPRPPAARARRLPATAAVGRRPAPVAALQRAAAVAWPHSARPPRPAPWHSGEARPTAWSPARAKQRRAAFQRPRRDRPGPHRRPAYPATV
jgi:hypothetical protein